MQFSANDIFQLETLLNPETESSPKGIFEPKSTLSPGTLGNTNSSKSKASPNHKVKATINRNPDLSNKKKFSAKGRPEPDHEVN